jgi:predicted phage tail protein
MTEEITEERTEEATEEEKVEKPKKEEAKFTQADVDRIIDTRLERERTKAEREREKAEEGARKKALEDQENWKDLAGTHVKTIEKLETRVSELEAVEGERDGAQSRIEVLEKLLRAANKDKLERVPELARDFVERMTPEEQAEWFEKNSEKLESPSGAGNGRPAGSRATGKAAVGVKGDEEAAKRARANQRSMSRI